MLSKEELQLLIKDIFVVGYEKNNTVKSKSGLSKKISSEIEKDFNISITQETIANYHRITIENNEEKGTDSTIIDAFIRYSTFKSVSKVKGASNKKIEEINANYNKIPFLKEDTKNNNFSKKEIKNTVKNTNHAFLAFCIVAIIAIVALLIINTSKTPNIKIVNDLRQVYPTKETQFFSPTTNEPLIFHANYNQKTEFFNANGVHPKTNEPLKPVTQEFVKTYFVEKLPVLTEKEQQSNVVFKKTNSNSKPLSKQKNSPKATNKKTEDVPKTTVIIKDDAKTDYELSSLFEKNYTKTTKPYICTGKVTYTYRKSDNGHFVCSLGLSYTITNNTTNKTVDKGFIQSKGAGLSASSAKNNALEKIQFD